MTDAATPAPAHERARSVTLFRADIVQRGDKVGGEPVRFVTSYLIGQLDGIDRVNGALCRKFDALFDGP